MYDVAIVGARCAGSALALMLAREGVRVLVIDRATFPSDTMSGHFIQPAGVSCLRRMGLLEALQALGYPPQERMTVDFGPVVLSGRPAPMSDGTATGYAPRRFRFDAMLADAAVAAGAELREGTSFLEPLTKEGRVAGIRTAGPSGAVEDIPASLVVGADGRRSRVARAVGAASYGAQPSATCTYYAYWEGMEVAEARLFVRDGLFAVAVPCGGTTFLAVAWPRSAFAGVRRDIDAAYRSAAARVPWLHERLAGARRAERYVGSGELDAFFRQASGPGWALLGDAGHHKDPITAQGMTDALLDAEGLARAVVEGLGGRRPLDRALEDWGRRRDERARPMHALTAGFAQLRLPPPEQLADMAVAASDPAATSRFLGVMAGSVPVEAVFGPQELASAA